MLTSLDFILEKECAKRMKMGLKQYGEYNPKKDKRDMMREIREEAIDIINYCRMHRQKKPRFDYLIENLAKEIYRLTMNVK